MSPFIYLISFLLTCGHATNYNIDAAYPSWSPSSQTINVDDQVTWNFASGAHNVYQGYYSFLHSLIHSLIFFSLKCGL